MAFRTPSSEGVLLLCWRALKIDQQSGDDVFQLMRYVSAQCVKRTLHRWSCLLVAR